LQEFSAGSIQYASQQPHEYKKMTLSRFARKIFVGDSLHLRLLLTSMILTGILGWEWGVRAGLFSPLYFPAPSVQLATLLHLAANGELAIHLKITLFRLLSGFLLGSAVGLVLGMGMGWFSRFRQFLDPLIAAIHPLPKIAIFPLLLILLGLGESAKIVAIALAALFPMLISAMAGVQQIHPAFFELAQSYGAGRRQTFRCVVLPGSLPLLLAGARLSLNVAWLVTIGVELVSAQNGLGALIWLGRETMHTEIIFAALFVISFLGFASNLSLQWLTRRLVPWQAERPSS
jgi:NitT/TauT family transport system permease protein